MMEILEKEMSEIMEVDCDDQTVEVVAIVGVTVLGAVAIVVDGDVGNTIAIAIAAALGAIIKGIFDRKAAREEVKE